MPTLTGKVFFISCLLVFSVPVFALNDTPVAPVGILTLKPYPSPVVALKDIDGQHFNLKETKGHWVFVHFWASWCGPCRKEMPAIQSMWNKLQKEGLKIALINTSEDEDTIFEFLGVYAPDIRALMDADGRITEQWRPRGLPATYLVAPNGEVRYQALGGRDWDTPTYLNFLRQLLKQQ